MHSAGEGRTVGCSSSPLPLSIPFHALSLSSSSSSSPSTAIKGTFNRTPWSLKKRPLAASDVISARSPGSVANLSENENENEKSHADDIVNTDNITLDNLLPDRGPLLLSRIAAHVRILPWN